MWQLPKTNWQRTDAVQVADAQRLRDNLLALFTQAQALYPLPQPAPMQTVTADSACTQCLLNTWENNIAALAAGTFNPGIAPAHAWQAGEATPTAADLNRLESAALLLRGMLSVQSAALPRLALSLGGGSF